MAVALVLCIVGVRDAFKVVEEKSERVNYSCVDTNLGSLLSLC